MTTSPLAWLENTEADDFSRLGTLSCNEIIVSKDASGDINFVHNRDTTECSGIGELENLELDIVLDFNVSTSSSSTNL